jgi:multiple sugar transport system substrate-binding protein
MRLRNWAALSAAALAMMASTGVVTAQSEPVEISFWAWSTNVEDMVALFEESHPNIKVNLVNTGGGSAQYEKLQVAFAAGSGAPDVAMIEHQYVLQYAMSGDIQPLDDLGGAEVKDDFIDSLTSQLSYDGKLYGIPLDASPLAFGYRTDLWEQAGLTSVPTTWAEFAEAAATYRAAHPDSYIVNSPISEGTLLYLWWQAGLTPIEVSGTTIDIDFANEAAEQILSYWVDLAQQDVISTLPAYSPEWNSAFASGALAGWVMPAWGPVIIGPAAPETSGLWRVDLLPTADGVPASAEWSGSSYTVTTQSEHPAEAAELAIWLNHDPSAYKKLFELTGSFPVLKSFATDQEFLATPFEFFGGQPVNATFAEALATVPTTWQWSPFHAVVKASVREQTAAAQTGTITPAEALANIQSTVVTYAQEQGFTVTTGQ